MRIDDLWEDEFYDFIKVLRFGENKHGKYNWLKVDGKKSSRDAMFNSMFHHLADAYAGSTADKESGLHPLLHLQSRAAMEYTLEQRGIVHKDDKDKDYSYVRSGASNCT